MIPMLRSTKLPTLGASAWLCSATLIFLALPSALAAQSLDAGVQFAADAGIVAAHEASDGDAGRVDAAVAVWVGSIDAGSDAPLVALEAPPTEGALTGVTDVTVRGGPRAAERMMSSAEAVNVLDLRRARQQSADLGEVLARVQGVGVRREGGLGSGATIALNGLQDDQIRLFLDGIPLDRAGYPFGITNVPVNLIERVDIYRGVLPIRLGADALGGAINLITDQRYETHLAASYQGGSFGIHRSSVNGRYRHDATGLVAGAAAFVDSAKNDFYMDHREIQLPDGSSDVRRVRRPHDRYLGYGGNVEVGVVDKRWARRLIAQGFASTFDKDVPHNRLMTLPYGEITRGTDSYGGTIRYDVDLTSSLTLESFLNYAHRNTWFRDISLYKYGWDGRRVDVVGRGGLRGEIGGKPTDQTIYEDSVYSRLVLTWTPAAGHALRASLTPSYVTRTLTNHLPSAKNYGLRDKLLQFVGGVEHQLDAFEDKLSNIAFAKIYSLKTSHEDRTETGVIRTETQRRDMRNWGVGDSLRYRFTPWLLAKASYEYTTRLPNAEELYGDGALVEEAADLRPERSHNVNVGPRLTLERTRVGSFIADVNGFVRETKDQIVFLASRQKSPYKNVSDMRGRGLENALSWAAPGRYLTLDSSLTWLDLRNTSSEGLFAAQKDMRMPNRPWLFASWGARLRFSHLPRKTDTLEPFYYGRWIHGFDRGWPIVAAGERLGVPTQTNHDLGITYTLTRPYGTVSTTFEVDNLMDAELFDLFGAQRPGRAFNLKISGQI